MPEKSRDQCSMMENGTEEIVWRDRSERPPKGRIWATDGKVVWLIFSDGKPIPDYATAVLRWGTALIPKPPEITPRTNDERVGRKVKPMLKIDDFAFKSYESGIVVEVIPSGEVKNGKKFDYLKIKLSRSEQTILHPEDKADEWITE